MVKEATPLQILPFGDRAILVELTTLDAVRALHEQLSATRPPGVIDLVPAARTVLVLCDPRRFSLAAARTWVHRVAAEKLPAATVHQSSPLVEIDVTYNGDDLSDIAAEIGESEEAVVAAHHGVEWIVAFTGFAPGFAYLRSTGWPHRIPRRASPRTRVPAGALGLADEFSGAYPRETPGGWQLIGSTSAPLFDPHAADPVLLPPRTRVRFRPARARVVAPSLADAAKLSPTPSVPQLSVAFTVREPGWHASVQDEGRVGRASLGIAPSGALDRDALRVANRLVGNAASAAGLEIVGGGFRAVAERDLWIAITGARGPMSIAGRPHDAATALRWPAGQELVLGTFSRGLRCYLAVRGGIEAPQSGGSRSTDILAGLGPAIVRAQQGFAVAGEHVVAVPPLDMAPWTPPPIDAVEVRLAGGPRAHWFTDGAHAALYEAQWRVGAASDRVGIRLDGPVLDRLAEPGESREHREPRQPREPRELPSEAMVPGALQVPPSGRPTILLADGPVTGGYPVIAVVTDDTRDALAQATPGTRIIFRRA